MKQTTYKVVTSDDQNLRHESTYFDHESEALTYARALAQGGRSAYVLKIETEFLAGFLPPTRRKHRRTSKPTRRMVKKPRKERERKP